MARSPCLVNNKGHCSLKEKLIMRYTSCILLLHLPPAFFRHIPRCLTQISLCLKGILLTLGIKLNFHKIFSPYQKKPEISPNNNNNKKRCLLVSYTRNLEKKNPLDEFLSICILTLQDFFKSAVGCYHACWKELLTCKLTKLHSSA